MTDGERHATPTRVGRPRLRLGTVAGPLTAATLAVSACVPSREDMARADYGSRPNRYETVVKDFLARVLKDPLSVQYRYITEPTPSFYAATRFSTPIYGWRVCATYNAKNSYGGYVGYRTDLFLIRDGSVRAYVPDDGRPGSSPPCSRAG